MRSIARAPRPACPDPAVPAPWGPPPRTPYPHHRVPCASGPLPAPLWTACTGDPAFVLTPAHRHGRHRRPDVRDLRPAATPRPGPGAPGPRPPHSAPEGNPETGTPSPPVLYAYPGPDLHIFVYTVFVPQEDLGGTPPPAFFPPKNFKTKNPARVAGGVGLGPWRHRGGVGLGPWRRRGWAWRTPDRVARLPLPSLTLG